MTRNHNLIQLRNAERQLAEAVKEIKKIQLTEDYHLDLQFFKELTDLMARYGYQASQVAEMLIARDPDIDSPAFRNTTMLYVNRFSEQIDMESDSGAEGSLESKLPATGDNSANPKTVSCTM